MPTSSSVSHKLTSVTKISWRTGCIGPSLVRRVTSVQLLGNEREMEIEHEGSVYRLRLTKAGKLILTK